MVIFVSLNKYKNGYGDSDGGGRDGSVADGKDARSDIENYDKDELKGMFNVYINAVIIILFILTLNFISFHIKVQSGVQKIRANQ